MRLKDLLVYINSNSKVRIIDEHMNLVFEGTALKAYLKLDFNTFTREVREIYLCDKYNIAIGIELK